MAQTLVQQSAEVVVTSGTTGSVTLTGVAAGNLLAILACNETDGTTFATPTDTNGNTWAIAVQDGTARLGEAMIAYAQNVHSGSTPVTVGPSSGSKTYHFKVLEISGSVTAGNPDVTSSIRESGTPTSHVCSADASHINPSGACFVLTAASCTASPAT